MASSMAVFMGEACPQMMSAINQAFDEAQLKYYINPVCVMEMDKDAEKYGCDPYDGYNLKGSSTDLAYLRENYCVWLFWRWRAMRRLYKDMEGLRNLGVFTVQNRAYNHSEVYLRCLHLEHVYKCLAGEKTEGEVALLMAPLREMYKNLGAKFFDKEDGYMIPYMYVEGVRQLYRRRRYIALQRALLDYEEKKISNIEECFVQVFHEVDVELEKTMRADMIAMAADMRRAYDLNKAPETVDR